jgi:hypothetical protein
MIGVGAYLRTPDDATALGAVVAEALNSIVRRFEWHLWSGSIIR